MQQREILSAQSVEPNLLGEMEFPLSSTSQKPQSTCKYHCQSTDFQNVCWCNSQSLIQVFQPAVVSKGPSAVGGLPVCVSVLKIRACVSAGLQ